MKKLIRAYLFIAVSLLLFSCGPTKLDEIVNLRLEKESMMLKIDVLNEKIMSLSTEVSDYNQAMAANSATYSNLIKDLQEQLESNESTIKTMGSRLKVTFVSDVFFDEGRAAIKPDGRKALDNIVKTLASLKGRLIRVEGYTDNVPIAPVLRGKYPSNWELSTARADAVVRYLVGKGVNPDLMKSAGYGKYNPVASNDTPEGRTKNRRIEIELVPLVSKVK